MTNTDKMESLEALHKYQSYMMQAIVWMNQIANDPSRFSEEELKERCEVASELLQLQVKGLAFISEAPESLEVVKELLD